MKACIHIYEVKDFTCILVYFLNGIECKRHDMNNFGCALELHSLSFKKSNIKIT